MRKRLPPQYRECVDVRLLGEAPVDLVVFETGPGSVVSLADLQKALEPTHEWVSRGLQALGARSVRGDLRGDLASGSDG
jgi:hypothetical protein